LLAFSVSKSIGNNIFFIINGLTDRQKITDERFTDENFPLVISSVILFTNGMVVQIPTENSVGKSKDCGRENQPGLIFHIYDPGHETKITTLKATTPKLSTTCINI